jgi:transposase InsO family protein
MTELNHCYENATAERLNGILKQEYGLDETFRNKTQAEQAVAQAVCLYNGSRPHLSLGYKTPNSVHSAA